MFQAASDFNYGLLVFQAASDWNCVWRRKRVLYHFSAALVVYKQEVFPHPKQVCSLA